MPFLNSTADQKQSQPATLASPRKTNPNRAVKASQPHLVNSSNLLRDIQMQVGLTSSRDKQEMYDKIKQIFSPNNPSNQLQNGFDGDMMLPFVNQRIVSVSKELKPARKPSKETPAREKKDPPLNVVSSKVTLEEKPATLDSLLARVGPDHVVDMGTNTTPLE